MRWMVPLVAVALSGCLSASGQPDSTETSKEGHPQDYHLVWDPEFGHVIGLSSQSLHHEFTLDVTYRLEAWAKWDRPYTTAQWSLEGPNGTVFRHYADVSGPDQLREDPSLGPGDYKVRLSVFGVHAIHAFETGGRFTPA